MGENIVVRVGENTRAAQRAAAQALEAADLAGQYANADTDADIPGAPTGERGALYWAQRAGEIANAETDEDVPGFAPGQRGAKYWADLAQTVSDGFVMPFGVIAARTTWSLPETWYADVSTGSAYNLTRFYGKVLSGTGTIDVYVLIDDAAVYGPRTLSTTEDDQVIALNLPAGSNVSFQFENKVGTVGSVVAKVSGEIA